MSDESQEEEDAVLRAPTLFKGRDLTKIPCMRGTILYGVAFGVVSAAATFLFTSRLSKASNASVYGFSGFALCYWFYCRHKMAVVEFETQDIADTIEHYRKSLGVEDDQKTN